MRKITLIALSFAAATGLAACNPSEPAAEPEQTTEVPAESPTPDGAMADPAADGAMTDDTAAPADGAMAGDAAAPTEAPEGGAPSSSGGRTTPPTGQ